MNWVTEELKYADLGDTRRNKRLVKIVEDLAGSQAPASLKQQEMMQHFKGCMTFGLKQTDKTRKDYQSTYSQNK